MDLEFAVSTPPLKKKETFLFFVDKYPDFFFFFLLFSQNLKMTSKRQTNQARVVAVANLLPVFQILWRCSEAKHLLACFLLTSNDSVPRRKRGLDQATGGSGGESGGSAGTLILSPSKMSRTLPCGTKDVVVVVFRTLAGHDLKIICNASVPRDGGGGGVVGPLKLSVPLPEDLLHRFQQHVSCAAHPISDNATQPVFFHNGQPVTSSVELCQCVAAHDPSSGYLAFETAFKEFWTHPVRFKPFDNIRKLVWHPHEPRSAVVWRENECSQLAGLYFVTGICTSNYTERTVEIPAKYRGCFMIRAEWNPQGTKVAACIRTSNAISTFTNVLIIDRATRVVQKMFCASHYRFGVWSHDGKHIWPSGYDSGFVIEVDTGRKQDFSSKSMCPASASFHPSLPLIGSGNQDGTKVHLYNLKGEWQRSWSSNDPELIPKYDRFRRDFRHMISSWSPNGRFFATSSNEDTRGRSSHDVHVWRVKSPADASGAEKWAVFSVNCIEGFTWTPCSQYLVVRTERLGIWRMVLWSALSRRFIDWSVRKDSSVTSVGWNSDVTMMVTTYNRHKRSDSLEVQLWR